MYADKNSYERHLGWGRARAARHHVGGLATAARRRLPTSYPRHERDPPAGSSQVRSVRYLASGVHVKLIVPAPQRRRRGRKLRAPLGVRRVLIRSVYARSAAPARPSCTHTGSCPDWSRPRAQAVRAHIHRPPGSARASPTSSSPATRLARRRDRPPRADRDHGLDALADAARACGARDVRVIPNRISLPARRATARSRRGAPPAGCRPKKGIESSSRRTTASTSSSPAAGRSARSCPRRSASSRPTSSRTATGARRGGRPHEVKASASYAPRRWRTASRWWLRRSAVSKGWSPRSNGTCWWNLRTPRRCATRSTCCSPIQRCDDVWARPPRADVAERFAWEHVTAATLTAYCDAVGRTPTPTEPLDEPTAAAA